MECDRGTGRSSRVVAGLLAVCLVAVAAACTPDKKPAAERGRLSESITLAQRDLPADPALAAEALVQQVHRGDPDRAQGAVAELLRRAGLPIVSGAGPVVAMPDEVALGDTPVYSELVPALTEAVRAGDRYTVAEFATMLRVLKVTTRALTGPELTAAIAGWGKGATDGPVFVSAAATVRALAAHRGQVLYPGMDPAQAWLDPLQTVLLLAHTMSRIAAVRSPAEKPRALGLADRLLGTKVAHAAPAGVCGELNKLLSFGDLPSEVLGHIRGGLSDAIAKAVLDDDGQEIYETATASHDIAAGAISAILLMLGARVELTADKRQTHFKHQAGSRSEHVTLTARAVFDIRTTAKKLECYALAGVDIPKAGPLEGFIVRWSSRQPQLGTVQQGGGQLLNAVSADSGKLQHGGTTDQQGRTTLELKPPVEDPAEQGTELRGTATWTAKLDQKNFPFDPLDLWDLATGAPKFAVLKSFELIKELLTKVGLPAQSISLTATFHGSDILVARGANSVNLLLAVLPKVYVDLVSCEGPKGPFQGVGGYVGAETNSFFREAWSKALGVQAPARVNGTEVRLSVLTNDRDGPNRFHMVTGEGGKPFLDGEISLFPELFGPNAAVVLARRPGEKYQQVGRPVGEVEILLAGKSYPFSNLTWPVARVASDPRCPAVEYRYDNS